MTNKIVVQYTSCDGYSETRQFHARCIEAAQEWAKNWIGAPEMGSTYAISGDGIGKIEVSGCSLAELFPYAY